MTRACLPLVSFTCYGLFLSAILQYISAWASNHAMHELQRNIWTWESTLRHLIVWFFRKYWCLKWIYLNSYLQTPCTFQIINRLLINSSRSDQLIVLKNIPFVYFNVSLILLINFKMYIMYIICILQYIMYDVYYIYFLYVYIYYIYIYII